MKKIKPKKSHKQLKSNNDTNSTLIGHSARRPIYIPDNSKHIFVCGTTGSGKTVALANFIKHGINSNYPIVLIDGKGDLGNGSLLDISKKLCINQKLYIINLSNPEKSDKYNPFQNASPTIIKDMLINMTDWSEQHYKVNAERYLQRLAILLQKNNIDISFKTIIENIPVEKFNKLSAKLMTSKVITKEEHLQNIEISSSSGKIGESATARFSSIYESELGCIFDENGIDIYTAIKENAVILFILNPLIYPEISPLMGRLILIDSKKAVSKCFNSNLERAFFIFDEINVYASHVLIDLINKSRSANITCILATQSLSDLDYACNEAFKEQIIENTNNYIVLRQNSAKNAEEWANILGTRQTLDVTYQIKEQFSNTSTTGLGSARRTREFNYHPDTIKSLQTGKGIYCSKDNCYSTQININNIL